MKTPIISFWICSLAFFAAVAAGEEPLRYALEPEHIECAVIRQQQNKYSVQIQLNKAETARFAELTRRHVGQRLQIVFADQDVVQATIRAEIPSGSINTSGWDDEGKAHRFAQELGVRACLQAETMRDDR